MAERIVVTGCTRGLGRVLVEGFVQRGHRVYGCGRRADALAALSAELGAAFSGATVDVSDPEAVRAWAQSIEADGGPPERVVSNAAVLHDRKNFLEASAEELAQSQAVNVAGVAHVLWAFLPGMVQRGSGVIINMSSGAGRQGFPGMAIYCASKFAVEGLSQAIAAELPEGVGVIPLAPGVIHTDMVEQIWDPNDLDNLQKPGAWADVAIPYILSLTAEHNGASLRVEQ